MSYVCAACGRKDAWPGKPCPNCSCTDVFRSDCTCTASVLALDCPVHGSEVASIVVDAIDAGRVIAAQPPGRCELCGAVEETRPYGPHGEEVCFDCGMKDEAAAKRGFDLRLGVAALNTEEPADEH